MGYIQEKDQEIADRRLDKALRSLEKKLAQEVASLERRIANKIGEEEKQSDQGDLKNIRGKLNSL